MNRIVYSVVLYLLSPLILAYFAFRGVKNVDYRGRFLERLGLRSLKQTDLLIHSVSMGETLAAIPLIRQIIEQNPQLSITVTTTSPTGSAQVLKALGDRVQHCYLPLDFSYSVKRFLAFVQPKYCIIMETELWPNLIHQLKRRNSQIMLANARLSEKSSIQYGKRRKLVVPMLQSLDTIAVQTAAEAKRFVDLGVDSQRIHVCGSLKFDIEIAPTALERAALLRQEWQKQDAPVWVAGSVHPGEFSAVLQAHAQILEKWPDAMLIMVPRHPEQFDAAALTIKSTGLTLARRSLVESVNGNTQVLLGDTMGELLTFYATADQAFVGGTLIENGGHNPLEPAALGLPVFVGPNHWDFAEISKLLEQAGALTVVENSSSLARGLVGYFDDREACNMAKQAGLEVVALNTGATQKQLHLFSRLCLGN